MKMNSDSAAHQVRNVARRSWRTTVAPILVFWAALSGMTLFVMWPLSTEFGNSGYGSYMTSFGSLVLDDLGNGLAVVAAVQFGVLIAIVGGQIEARSAVDEANLRTALMALATLPVLAMSPAVTLAAVAAFRVAEHRGAMFVVLPVYLTQLAMSLFISTFEVGDRVALRSFAAKRLVRARRRVQSLEDLPRCSLLPALAVILLELLLVTAIPAVVAKLIVRTSWAVSDGAFAGVVAVLTLGVPMSVMLLVLTNLSSKPTVEPIGVTFGGVMLALSLFLTVLGAVGAWMLFWPLGVGLSVAFVAILALVVQSWREASAVRKGTQFTGYAWWAGGLIMQAGTHLALKASRTDLLVALRQLGQYRSQGSTADQ